MWRFKKNGSTCNLSLSVLSLENTENRRLALQRSTQKYRVNRCLPFLLAFVATNATRVQQRLTTDLATNTCPATHARTYLYRSLACSMNRLATNRLWQGHSILEQLKLNLCCYSCQFMACKPEKTNLHTTANKL